MSWIKSTDLNAPNTNPYYEKWGKGRPTKEMVKKRILANEWELDNDPLFRLLKQKNAPGNITYKQRV